MFLRIRMKNDVSKLNLPPAQAFFQALCFYLLLVRRSLGGQFVTFVIIDDQQHLLSTY